MIDGLMTCGRLGRLPPAAGMIDLNEVVVQSLQVLRPAIDHRVAEVRLVGQLPRAAVNASLVEMIFTNLVSNALKFNESNPPRVEIGFDQARDAVYVRDNGIGIAPEHHEAIFVLFRRLHSRKKYDGAGAGLAIVRKIAESLGGKVWVESEPEQGSTFYVRIGSAKRPAAPASKRPKLKPAAAKPPHWLLVRA